ncbi:hypothetical protein B0J13DRAFT_602156 [Dactylonectria estremocensis]|uniref:ABM domain-containing protein n=1 Tax=Dactylonectria estremocensis TaxID=1079267 RepID=A0A9P9FBR5_9HYPO|nr:hypothetical protein B0J13DRAFT_602156 [Dactylonectria estremocensis]
MAFIEIIQCKTSTIDIIHKAFKALEEVKTPQSFALGTHTQDQGVIQVTSEWDGAQGGLNFQDTPEHDSFIQVVHNFFGKPRSVFHAILDQSAFGPDGLATANAIEFVQIYFPSSRVTPEFQKKIEKDFSKFDGIFKKGAKGDLGLACGWVLKEQDHEGIKGEKAKSFFVTRGWESMEHFHQSVDNDNFKEAMPLLLAWNAPFTMWHVERKP